ncbi:MAG: S41 family peptidase [Bacteroidota bacterium]
MKSLIAYFLSGFLLLLLPYKGYTQLSHQGLIDPNLLKVDLDSLYQLILSTHADPEAFISQEELARTYHELRGQITHPMSAIDFYQLVNPLVTSLKDVHSRIWINLTAAHRDGYYLPFTIRYLEGKTYLLEEPSGTIPVGSELLTVNGFFIQHIIEALLKEAYTDGETNSTRIRLMEESFKFLLPVYFPIDSSNLIRYTSATDAKDTMRIAYKGVKRKMPTKKKNAREGKSKPLYWETYPENSVGYLYIPSFSEARRKKYNRELKKAFRTFSALRTKSLIIDVRDNKGGFINRGTELLSYLSPKPYKYIDYTVVKSSQLLKDKIKRNILWPSLSTRLFKKVVDKELVYAWKNEVGQVDTIYWEDIAPHKKFGFTGDTYLLVNGLSLSNSSLVHQAMSHHNLAISIGEPSGGTSHGTFGHTVGFRLPFSHISGILATIRILAPHSSFEKETLTPDFVIPDKIEDILNERDSQLDFTWELIRARRHKLAIQP